MGPNTHALLLLTFDAVAADVSESTYDSDAGPEDAFVAKEEQGRMGSSTSSSRTSQSMSSLLSVSDFWDGGGDAAFKSPPKLALSSVERKRKAIHGVKTMLVTPNTDGGKIVASTILEGYWFARGLQGTLLSTAC